MRLLAIIILTQDEEANLARCLASISPLQPEILIVDSGSTDRTLEIAKEYGARVLYNPWKNHSAQLNWAIEHLESDALWVARLDADEYLTSELALELTHVLSSLPDEYSGLLVKRRVFFLGRWMKHGGYYPIWLLRFWRQGKANCEERWMDEHLALVDGTAYKLANDIVDRNMKGLTFWIDKHNHYASREVIDLLGLKESTGSHQHLDRRTAFKRWIKESLYSKLPLFHRAFLYWFSRYFLRLGFLDGKEGLAFHFLQAFWYRFLVDAKILEHKIQEQSKADAPFPGAG